jgi:hypothetical protein
MGLAKIKACLPASLPAKFSLFQMERFANAIMEPAKIAYLSSGCGVGKKLK